VNDSRERLDPRAPLWRYAIATVPLILAIGIFAGRASNPGPGNGWFDTLAKPEMMPPGWAFGAAWSVLYILLGIAIALILRRRGAPGWKMAVGLFSAQMLLNFSWSPVFFGLHRPALAFVIIMLMLVLTIAAAFLFRRIDRQAAWLMVPYLAWLVFASILNFEIIELNRGG
jgi:tryptophan-rich sensory protein